MINTEKKDALSSMLLDGVNFEGEDVFRLSIGGSVENQLQTNKVFSEKWGKQDKNEDKEVAWKYQKRWYLELYGFSCESEFAGFLQERDVILDAGCGLGYKAAWFAELSPQSVVIAMDYSSSVYLAANSYGHLENIIFVQGDIGSPIFKPEVIDYVSCDQVIMHYAYSGSRKNIR